jgi:hypothetical protein
MITYLAIVLAFSPLSWSWGFVDPSAPRPYIAAGNCDTSRIDSDQRMQSALHYLSQRHNGGRPVRLSSCFRDQFKQVTTCRSICGQEACPGRCARNSEHTNGIAADLAVGRSADEACHILQDVRSNVLQGQGGVGGYGGAYGHLDVRPGRCTWNHCARVLREGCFGYNSPAVQQYVAEQIQLWGATP